MEGLKDNLLSISQLCDRGYQVTFRTNSCEIRLPNSKEVLLVGKRSNNVYLLDISNSTSISFLLTKQEESWLWHRRIAHIHMHHLNKLIKNDLVISLPKLRFEKEHVVKARTKAQLLGCSWAGGTLTSVRRARSNPMKGRRSFSRLKMVAYIKKKGSSGSAWSSTHMGSPSLQGRTFTYKSCSLPKTRKFSDSFFLYASTSLKVFT